MTTFSDLTTLRVGGPVSTLVEADTEQDFIGAVRDADQAGRPLLVLGGGSNLLAGDDGFPGVVVRDTRSDISIQDDGMCGGVSVTATAGVPWDDMVLRATQEGWVGIEALSGIPGSTGATPVQNVGAYGAQVSDVIATVRVWDRLEERVRSMPQIDCRFGYRDSVLKRSMRGLAPDEGVWHPTPRYVVLDVTFQMRPGTRSGPIEYAQLAEALGIEPGGRAPIVDVREAVLNIRAAKGMVLDAEDPDTWSAGSFFTNPVLEADVAAGLPDDAPRFETASGRVKSSAAWLIEQAGFARGFSLEGSAAALSTKHTLALTNRGGATAADIETLARAIRDGVHDRFGITLVPEPVLLGARL